MQYGKRHNTQGDATPGGGIPRQEGDQPVQLQCYWVLLRATPRQGQPSIVAGHGLWDDQAEHPLSCSPAAWPAPPNTGTGSPLLSHGDTGLTGAPGSAMAMTSWGWTGAPPPSPSTCSTLGICLLRRGGHHGAAGGQEPFHAGRTTPVHKAEPSAQCRTGAGI